MVMYIKLILLLGCSTCCGSFRGKGDSTTGRIQPRSLGGFKQQFILYVLTLCIYIYTVVEIDTFF